MKEVKSPKRPLIYYYLIVMVILLLFNMLAVPWITEHQIKEVDYGTFISMTENGEVGKAEIQEQDNRILFTDKDETTIYKTAMVNDPDLTARLYAADVKFYGVEIEQTSLLVQILAWVLPLVIFIGIGQLMSKKLMEKAGGARVLLEGEFDADSLLSELKTLLADEEKLSSMSRAMRSLAVPDATEKICGIILDLLH